MTNPITPADLDELTAALAPLDDLTYPPDVSADGDGSYECPACGGEGRVDGVATAGGGTAGGTCADIQTYGIQCYGIGHGHIELEHALRLMYRHRNALLAAARERDALRAELEAHKGAANKLRSDLAAEVRRLRAELIEANALLEACARQFVASDYDGKLHHSCMWTDQALCRHLVKIGSLVREGEDHFRWVEQKPTMPTGQENSDEHDM